MMIKFYSVTDEYGSFSNFSDHEIHLDGKTWPSVEHYFQSCKTDDPVYVKKVRIASTPSLAARKGRSRRMKKIRRNWDSIKDNVMRKAVYAKFSQHPDLRSILLSTADAEIVEVTTTDRYWGKGADGKGLNKLGRILMETRERLRGEIVDGDGASR